MSRKYYTLAILEDGIWAPQFGDYDRDCVKFEADDYKDHGTKLKDIRIICTKDDQASIESAVSALNSK